MQTASTITASVVLAVVASAVVVKLMVADQGEAPSGPENRSEAGGAEQVQQELAGLRQEVEKLRQQLAKGLDRQGAAALRRPVDPVSDKQIQRAIARWAAENPQLKDALLRGKAGKAGKAGRPDEAASLANQDFDVGQSFLQLAAEGLSYEQSEAIWKKVKAAGQLDAMIGKFEEMAANAPNDADAHVALGAAYSQKLMGMPPGPDAGNLATKVDKTYDRALELDPQHWDARFNKAISLSFWPPLFGKQPEALRQFETLRQQQEASGNTKPIHVQTYIWLGNLYSQQGKDDKAKETWRKGVRFFPQNAELKKKLGL